MFTHKLAHTPTDREQVLALIQETYGAAYAGNNYRQSISDAYFGQIVVESIMLFAQGRLVGTISLMHNRHNPALPTPSEFLLGYQRPAHLPQNVVEVGRLAKVLNTGLAPTDEARILPMLFWLISRRLTERNLDGFVATVQPKLFRKLVQIGLPGEVLKTGFQAVNAVGFGAYTNNRIIYFYSPLAESGHRLSHWSFDGYLSPAAPAVCPLRSARRLYFPISA